MAIDPSRQSPRVPPEISDEIIRHLDPDTSRKTLLQCTLVSHTWQAASKYALCAEPGFLTLEKAYIFVTQFFPTIPPTLPPPGLFASIRKEALRKLMMVVNRLAVRVSSDLLDLPSIFNLPQAEYLKIASREGETENLLDAARRLVQGSSPRLQDIHFYFRVEALTSAPPAALRELSELTSRAPFSDMNTVTFFLSMDYGWDHGKDDLARSAAVNATGTRVVEILTGALPDFVKKTQVTVELFRVPGHAPPPTHRFSAPLFSAADHVPAPYLNAKDVYSKFMNVPTPRPPAPVVSGPHLERTLGDLA
ncbi:uncharacterized protein BXZ73DRAFT_99044 [Epithele typhae]|uniref:uncharacterized protein n=1 Tax=Epithele typhae TaxID=378194 RepID=UPI0020086B5C|nr:uncharacterized protein BXZ73DRAFT_99044 [Epithele typhae]KAH9940050.1 hypothetical protein BXZ73DRAFT_99044 [Epithele typhae]